eukprot:gene18158-biopygen12946
MQNGVRGAGGMGNNGAEGAGNWKTGAECCGRDFVSKIRDFTNLAPCPCVGPSGPGPGAGQGAHSDYYFLVAVWHLVGSSPRPYQVANLVANWSSIGRQLAAPFFFLENEQCAGPQRMHTHGWPQRPPFCILWGRRSGRAGEYTPNSLMEQRSIPAPPLRKQHGYVR